VSRFSILGSFLPCLFILGLVSGCGDDGPSVASDVPTAQITPAADLSKGRPKGMPKNISAGLKLDPTTGRPQQE